MTTAVARPSPPPPHGHSPPAFEALDDSEVSAPPFPRPDPAARRGQKGPGPAPATDGGWPRRLRTRQKPDSRLRRLDIEPGSFIYTVKVTSKFLRLERLLVQVVACVWWGGRRGPGALRARAAPRRGPAQPHARWLPPFPKRVRCGKHATARGQPPRGTGPPAPRTENTVYLPERLC